MKLHWGPMSPFVRKVMIAVHELGLADRVTLVRSPVAMNRANPDVMRDNPLSKIPTLVRDDGTALYDSDVICEYLDSLHAGPALFPPNGEPRWQALRWNALGSGMLDALVLWRNERMRPAEHRSPETLVAYERKCAATLALIERDIALLDAKSFRIGHIAIGCLFGYLDLRFDDVGWRHAHPASERWMAAFSQRPSARQTEATFADTLVPAAPASPGAPQ